MSQDQSPAQSGAMPPGGNMSEEEAFAYTQGIRVKVVQRLMPSEAIPTETSDRIMLKDMLDGIDRQAMGRMRIKQDQKNNDNTAAVVAELLRNIDKNAIFRGPAIGNDSNVIDGVVREVPNTIADVPALPGEMDVSPPQLDYATFVRSQGKDVDQLGKDVQHPESEGDSDE